MHRVSSVSWNLGASTAKDRWETRRYILSFLSQSVRVFEQQSIEETFLNLVLTPRHALRTESPFWDAPGTYQDARIPSRCEAAGPRVYERIFK